MNILADSRRIAEDFNDPCVSFEHVFLAILESSREKRIEFLTKKLENENLDRKEERRLERQLRLLEEIKTKKFRHTFFRQRRKYLKKFYSSLKIFSKSYSSSALYEFSSEGSAEKILNSVQDEKNGKELKMLYMRYALLRRLPPLTLSLSISSTFFIKNFMITLCLGLLAVPLRLLVVITIRQLVEKENKIYFRNN